ncbi:phage tail sheath subtilisin-like domain-containing protein [Paenibacillus anseongense]|uniref:phage tail sheath subtilisin-like domain-containing protein n=1 Tax=Paenibacillus anseongense TaxID=2682845 RepID=UPI002DB7EEB7|nr:phage tail sheath subtilisin-like domain-containing protein [Paenibacillus anseongense]MEC0264446.1 phage tail sheath subtilisin-like domain-containing protein [Paenibacillus anseongense]
MAGGAWSETDRPVLPGFYMNFEAAALSAILPGSQGVVAVPVKANWGAVRQFVEITSEQGIYDAFGRDQSGSASAQAILKLALLGKPKKVLAYRIADATAAKAALTLKDSASANVLKLEAKYEGTRGNSFSIIIQTNAVDASKKDLKLLEGSSVLKTFTFSGSTVQAAADALNQDSGNPWLTATILAPGNGTLAAVSGSALTGGSSGISGIASADYLNALSALETQEFHVLALDGVTDTGIQASVAAWTSRLRSEGKGIITVLGGSTADDTASDAASRAAARSALFNHEAIVNVGTGAVLAGTSYSSAWVAAYVAGLIAGQKLSESTTYAAAPFSDVTRRWTRSEQESSVRNGVFLLYHDGQRVKTLRGMNSLVSLRQGQNAAWKKIRTIRVMDAINQDLLRTAEEGYIGKVNNTEEGRLALVESAKQYMQTLAQAGVIEATSFDVYLDPAYYGETAELTPEPDQVYIKWDAQLTDVMEQIFGTFIVH